MKSLNFYILFILFSVILCKTKAKMMLDFALCAKDQIGKPYVTYDSRGPDSFSNSGLVWYCRGVAGLSTSSTIYVSWKRVKNPLVGAHIYGITKDNGASVSGDCLGVVVQTGPTLVVAGDEEKGVLVSKEFIPDPKYIRIEYHYVDF